MKYTDHYFRVEIAARHGIDVAIFVRDIYAWCSKNRDNEDAFHAGRYWTYNKMSAFCKRHPYWSKRQLERIIAASKDAGLILIDRFNKDPMGFIKRVETILACRGRQWQSGKRRLQRDVL